jgi:hypothetical protein
MKQAAEEEDEAKGDDDEEQQQQQQGPPAADDDNEDEEEARMLRGEELVQVAARHVEMAQQQRCLYQVTRKAAIATVDQRPSERILCYVADYAQNMYVGIEHQRPILLGVYTKV